MVIIYTPTAYDKQTTKFNTHVSYKSGRLQRQFSVDKVYSQLPQIGPALLKHVPA